MHLALIVAASENDVIGRNNALPWHLPEDLKYFKRVTLGKPIIMGRNTYESIGRPLPGRTNIVVTHNRDYCAEGVRIVHSLDEAVALAEDVARIDGAEEAVVIGGADAYRYALDHAFRLYLTRVHGTVAGDVYLPQINWDDWREMSCQRIKAEPPAPFDYSFVVYERIN